MKALSFSVTAALLSASVVQAQLTWDVVPGAIGIGDNAITSSNGAWNATAGNWTADGGTNNVAWVSGSNAAFSSGTYQVGLTNTSAVTVGDLIYGGGGILEFKGSTLTGSAGDLITVNSGGATWNTGGGEIEFFNDGNNYNTRLAMTSTDTLTVQGGGTFDTGQNPQNNANGNWPVADAILDFQAGVLVGNPASVGQFKTVKLSDGTTYRHDRNASQTYVNDWDLGTGTVTFTNRHSGNGSITLNGDVIGSGTMVIACRPTRFVRLNNATNTTFTGKYNVGTASAAGSELLNYAGDLAYGPVPGTVVSNYFTLANGGELKLNGFEIHANRGITLAGTGAIICNSNPTTYGGKITGDGQFIVGRNDGSDGNQLILSSNTHDYTGGTRILQGSIKLGTDNVFPADGLLTLGGKGNARLYMNGFDQTTGGLNLGGGSTKEVVNNTNILSTLTFDVAAGQSYNYAGNINGAGDNIALVKDGDGTQRITRGGGFTKTPVSIAVNGGVFEQSCGALPTPITVNSGGTLGGIGTTTADVVVNSGGSIAPGNDGGWNSVKISGADLDLSGMIDDNTGGLQIGFGSAKDSIIASTNAIAVGGTINMDGTNAFDLGFADFTFTTRYASDLPDGTYAIIVAHTLVGSIDTNDNSGAVGDLGATGELSISNNTVWLTVDGADSSKYGQWARQYELPIDAENVDTDGDGYDNLQEFAYGGDPTNSGDTGYAPEVGTYDDGVTNWLTVVYGEKTNATSGIDYTVETANDLVNGTWTNDVTFMGYGVTVDDITPVTNAIPIEGTQDFLGVFLEKQE